MSERSGRWDREARATAALRLLHAPDDSRPFPDRILQEFLQRLSRQQELRFFVDGTKNLGHQSATVALMKRLIELTDFGGSITLVYADYGRALLGSTKEKLALLLPGADPRNLSQCVIAHHTCTDIRFLEYGERYTLRTRVEFGFSGGADDMSINYARELNVEYFSRLQPYLWDDDVTRKSDPYYESSRIEQPNDSYFYPVDVCEPFRRLIHKPAPSRALPVSARTWSWYERQQRFDPQLAVRTRNIRSVLEACGDSQGALLWPTYGLQHFGELAPLIALRCAALALFAQEHLRRPIVLLSLSPPHGAVPECTLVRKLAADLAAGRAAAPGLKGVRIAIVDGLDESNGEAVDIASALTDALAAATSASVDNTRDGVGPHRVIVARVGLVPGPAFDSAIARAGLPCVIEGQSSTSLAVGFGKAFLQMPRPGHLITNSYPTTVGGEDCGGLSERLNAAAQRLCAPAQGDEDMATPRADLSEPLQVILESLCAGSEVARYFERIGAFYGDARRDKVLAGCRALAELVDT